MIGKFNSIKIKHFHHQMVNLPMNGASVLHGIKHGQLSRYNLQTNQKSNPSTYHASFIRQVLYSLTPFTHPKTQSLLSFPLQVREWRHWEVFYLVQGASK